MNRVAKVDIRKFLGITETYNKGIDYYRKIEDPSYITFTLKFEFEVPEIENYPITNGTLLCSAKNDSSKFASINSANDYLRSINRKDNARMLTEFIEQLKDIENNRPWTFQTITGLDTCMKFDKTKILQRKEAEITVECLDYFDRQFLLLQSLYNNAVYDVEFNRFLLPLNFAQFNCDIIISEFNEKFEVTTEPPNVETFIKNELEAQLNASGMKGIYDDAKKAGGFLSGLSDSLGSAVDTVSGWVGSASDAITEYSAIAGNWIVDSFSKNIIDIKTSNKSYDQILQEELTIAQNEGKDITNPEIYKSIEDAAMEKYIKYQNSPSVDSVLSDERLNTIINKAAQTDVGKLLGADKLRESFNNIKNAYAQSIAHYLVSIKDKCTYTKIRLENCTFDFGMFESYNNLSAAGQPSDFVKGKFKIKPKKVYVSHDFGIHKWVLGEFIRDMVTNNEYVDGKYTEGVYINDEGIREKNRILYNPTQRTFDLNSTYDKIGNEYNKGKEKVLNYANDAKNKVKEKIKNLF